MDIQAIETQYRQVEAIVRRDGVAVITGDGGGGLAPVTFTVGVAAQGLPDLIIYGLAPSQAAPVVNTTVMRIKDAWPFPSRTRFEGILQGYEVALRDVSRSDLLARIMFLTQLYNMRNALTQTPILQICWPDTEGRMPFEAGCDPAVAGVQRIKSLRS